MEDLEIKVISSNIQAQQTLIEMLYNEVKDLREELAKLKKNIKNNLVF